MANKRRIFISDVHMGGIGSPKLKKIPDDRHDFDWLDKKDADNLADFLNFLKTYPRVSEVVILGDLLDVWVWPTDLEPPSFLEVCQNRKNQGIVKAFSALVEAGIPVTYVPGNHDMGVTKEDVAKGLPGVRRVDGNGLTGEFRAGGRLLAEHGHDFALFNAPDPVYTRPLGYFISRADATSRYRFGGERRWWTYLDNLKDVIINGTAPPIAVLEAVCEEAGLSDSDAIVMPSGSGRPSIPIGEVKDRYKDLYKNWNGPLPGWSAAEALAGDMGLLMGAANLIAHKGGTKIILFGHTHNAYLNHQEDDTKGRIYGNCGKWWGDQRNCTFIETEKNPKNNTHLVRLMAWRNGKPFQRQKETIWYRD